MSGIDLEAEYNNRARVPEHPGIIQGWARDAAAYRDTAPPTRMRYGESERATIDLFGDGADMLFIHGGYWQSLDKSYFSHLARGLNAHGFGVAIMSYDLCPQVRIGEIVKQARAASAALAAQAHRPLLVSGHSAGGHLGACLLATEPHVHAAYAISGLFELTPLIPTSLNTALRMDEDEAERFSPLYWPAPRGKTLDAIVGGAESSEFHRQSHAIVDLWGAAGVATSFATVEGANHFTVIAPLSDPHSAMCVRLKALIEAAH